MPLSTIRSSEARTLSGSRSRGETSGRTSRGKSRSSMVTFLSVEPAGERNGGERQDQRAERGERSRQQDGRDTGRAADGPEREHQDGRACAPAEPRSEDVVRVIAVADRQRDARGHSTGDRRDQLEREDAEAGPRGEQPAPAVG